LTDDGKNLAMKIQLLNQDVRIGHKQSKRGWRFKPQMITRRRVVKLQSRRMQHQPVSPRTDCFGRIQVATENR
jgi:hypothetical protein